MGTTRRTSCAHHFCGRCLSSSRVAIVRPALVVASLGAILSNRTSSSGLSFVFPSSSRAARGGLLCLNAAKPRELEPEPDLGLEFTKIVQEVTGTKDEQPVTPEQRVTPLDRWLGFDKSILNGREYLEYLVDASDESSYVTVVLKKPLGIEFVENEPENGGGVQIGELRPGFSAFSCQVVASGYQLIVANDVPVYGLPLEQAIAPIMAAEGEVKMTFFRGEAKYFYGPDKPCQEWFADFLDRLQDAEVDDDQ